MSSEDEIERLINAIEENKKVEAFIADDTDERTLQGIKDERAAMYRRLDIMNSNAIR